MNNWVDGVVLITANITKIEAEIQAFNTLIKKRKAEGLSIEMSVD